MIRNFIRKYPITTAGEVFRSFFKIIFVKSLQKIIPDIRSEMLEKSPSGIRAQLMNPNGNLEQDFDIKIKKILLVYLMLQAPLRHHHLVLLHIFLKN